MYRYNRFNLFFVLYTAHNAHTQLHKYGGFFSKKQMGRHFSVNPFAIIALLCASAYLLILAVQPPPGARCTVILSEAVTFLELWT